MHWNEVKTMNHVDPAQDPDLARRAHENQARLKSRLRASYDFIVCGAASPPMTKRGAGSP